MIKKWFHDRFCSSLRCLNVKNNNLAVLHYLFFFSCMAIRHNQNIKFYIAFYKIQEYFTGSDQKQVSSEIREKKRLK